MSKKMEKALHKAAILTFEELGFLFAMDDQYGEQEEGPSPAGEANISASVRFHGPLSGMLVVTASPDLLPAVAANMLGEEEIPSLAQQYDSLGEISNVICGNVLPAIAGTDKVFHIAAPVVAEGNYAEETEPAAAVHLGLEQGHADVLLFIRAEGSRRTSRAGTGR